MDNHVLVNTMSAKEVSDFVTVLRQRKHHSYLKFLRVLCVCNGAAIQEFQNLVCKKILEDAHDCVYLTDVAEKGSKKSVVVRTSVDAKVRITTVNVQSSQSRCINQKSGRGCTNDEESRK